MQFVNPHSGQPKPNLRRKRKALSGLEGLLEIVGLEVMAESVSDRVVTIVFLLFFIFPLNSTQQELRT